MDVIYLFDERYAVRDIVSEIAELTHTEHAYACFARFKTRKEIGEGWGVGFRCIDGRFRIFEIDDAATDETTGLVSANATDAAVRELLDEPLTDRRPTNLSPAAAVSALIANTRFTLGRVTASGAGSMRAYYQNVWSALEEAKALYGCEIVPYFEFEDGRVTGRRVDVLARIGDDRGRVFEVGDDAQNVVVEVDYSGIKTALYGRGKGVEIEGDEDTGTSYGRRLTFADVAWSVANGDPADKPLGQEWIGDPDALEAFGRGGRHRFGFAVFEEVTDPHELLRLTWEDLQARKKPVVTVTATVADTESAWGRDHEAVRLGDGVGVNIRRRKVFVAARVTGIVRDYIEPAKTQLTIGNARMTAAGILQAVKRRTDSYADRAAVWDRANAFDLDGAMDVMNNQIRSAVGGWYTDKETGGIMFVSSDGKLAMRLTGAGWQIADGQTGGAWNWRTAATGKGLVADEIKAGKIDANLVTFSGTGTFLDGTTLIIQHPQLSEGARTELGLDGLRMMQGERIVGGLYKKGDRVLSAVQSLYNPDSTMFEARVGTQSAVGLEGYGIDLLLNGIVGGHVGAFTLTETGNDQPAGTALHSTGLAVVDGRKGVQVESGALVQINASGAVEANAGEGMTFSFMGTNLGGGRARLSFTAQQIWDLIARSGGSDD